MDKPIIPKDALEAMLQGIHRPQQPDELNEIINLLTTYPQLIPATRTYLNGIIAEIGQAVKSVMTKYGV